MPLNRSRPPDEYHVVLAEPQLAVPVLGEWLVGGTAKFCSDPAGHDGGAGMVHEPPTGRRIQDKICAGGDNDGIRGCFRKV